MSVEVLEREPIPPMSAEERNPSALGGKYLTFRLGKEQYGLEILKVREIMGWINITPVPKAPTAVRGVLNLRGKIIPVIDLRRKFGMDLVADTDRSCIIVVDVLVNGINADAGILVDTVSEVLNISHEDISPPPCLGYDTQSDFILGIARSQENVTILLEIENVLHDSDVNLDLHSTRTP